MDGDHDLSRAGSVRHVGRAGVAADGLLHATFDRAPVAMAIADPEGRLLAVNDSLCAFLGYTADELRALTFADVTFGEDLTRRAESLRRLAEGMTSEVVEERRYVTASGGLAWGRATEIAVRDASGTVERVVTQIEDLGQQRAAEAALRHLETHDELTDLATRHVFYERLRAALAHRRRAARHLAVLVVNLDRFQQVNAGLGHVDADQILVEVGRRLEAALRRKDSAARLGGDWFAVLAPGVTTPEDAVALAVNMRHRLCEPYWAAGNAVYVSARIGVVTAPDDGSDPVTLLRRATAATAQAKLLSSGWAMSTVGADVAGRAELSEVSQLRSAIDAGELTVAYQPMVDLEGRVHGFEALARWDHAQRGPVSPDQFIISAEQSGLIAPLTRQVLATAVQQAVRWGSPDTPVPVAVNLSGKLLAEPTLVEDVRRSLAAAKLPAAALTLEITETALAEGSSEVVGSALRALRQLGVRISIDDFGTGYSSLTYLKELPIDELKIDRSFISSLGSDDRAERIVRSIIDLAHSLDISVVGEGVEDDAVAGKLIRLGVDYLQGYAIARPATSEVVTAWLRDRSLVSAGDRARMEVGRKLDVLVVDDHLETRAALRRRLRERNYRVVEAGSGTAALDRLRRRMPDLIILDDLMPGLTGVETAPRLREAGYSGPILLFSGAAPEDLAVIRFPMDVWPVSKSDEATLLRLIDGYAGVAEPIPTGR